MTYLNQRIYYKSKFTGDLISYRYLQYFHTPTEPIPCV